MAELAVIEKESALFQRDTDKLGQATSDFINSFYPSYGVNNELAATLPLENSLELLNTFTFYEICECTIHNVENRMEYFSEKMKKLFITAYSIKQVVCYGIVSNNGKTSLVIGVDPKSNDTTIKTILEGLLPGVKIAPYAQRFTNARIDETHNSKDKDRYVGCICGVPSLKVNGQIQNKDLSSLMRSLNGQNYLGVRFSDFEGQEEKYAELVNYYNSLKDKQKELHDAEYNAILSGEKPLDYHHEEGEYCSGDVVYGISAEVVRDLHCGRYIDGFGTVVDYELQSSDISVMKKHYEEWSKQQAAIKAERERKIKEFEEEKAKMLKGVQWDIEEHSLFDEGGSTKCYIHTITINNETFVFQERNIFDFGRVINPCYSISPGIESGGIMLRDDDGYYWYHSKDDKAIRITVTDTELHAYQIVAKYGKFVKAGIRM